MSDKTDIPLILESPFVKYLKELSPKIEDDFILESPFTALSINKSLQKYDGVNNHNKLNESNIINIELSLTSLVEK